MDVDLLTLLVLDEQVKRGWQQCDVPGQVDQHHKAEF
jgi:hypothetical protein